MENRRFCNIWCSNIFFSRVTENGAAFNDGEKTKDAKNAENPLWENREIPITLLDFFGSFFIGKRRKCGNKTGFRVRRGNAIKTRVSRASWKRDKNQGFARVAETR